MSLSMMFRDRKFAPLMWTQFFGALNDNVLKNALVVLLAFKGIELWGLRSDSLISLATLVFILPFFIFSALAGQLADKFEKSRLIRWSRIYFFSLSTPVRSSFSNGTPFHVFWPSQI